MAPNVVTTGSEGTAALATIEEWLARPAEEGAELIHGRIVRQAMPDPEHGNVQGRTFAWTLPFNRREGDDDRPGGWWISQEVDLAIGGDGVRPDVCGWRRDRHTRRPRTGPRGVVTDAPDWVCEVLSPSTASRDLGAKLATYHRAGVDRYWVIDPANRTVTVLRHTTDGYLFAGAAGIDDLVQLEPFAAIDLRVVDLFEMDDEPGATAR